MATQVISVQTDEATVGPAAHATSARSVPSCSWRAHWLTVNEFAHMMGRHPQTVYSWINNNTLAEFGFPVCQFRRGGLHSGRVFIQNII
jgi:hypothetical protein